MHTLDRHGDALVKLAARRQSAAVIRERAQCVVDACAICRGAEGSGFARRPERRIGDFGHVIQWVHRHSPTPRVILCRAFQIYDRHIAEGGDVEQLLPPAGLAE